MKWHVHAIYTDQASLEHVCLDFAISVSVKCARVVQDILLRGRDAMRYISLPTFSERLTVSPLFCPVYCTIFLYFCRSFLFAHAMAHVRYTMLSMLLSVSLLVGLVIAQSSYWVANIERQGTVPFGAPYGVSSSYPVFRNVKDYGAVGTLHVLPPVDVCVS